MYFFEQLMKIVRPVEKDVPIRYFVQSSVEIDNPFHDCTVSVPCFIEDSPKLPDYVNMKASCFGLQTLLEAGVSLQPSTVVNGSYLREVEKFMNKVATSKV